MNTPIKKQTKTSLIIALVLVAFIAAYTVSAYHFQWWPFQQDTPTSQEVSDPTVTPGKETIPTGEYSDKTTDEIPTNTALSATFDVLEQQNGIVTAKASVNTDDTTGLCSFVFSNENDRPLTQTANPTLKEDRIICGPVEIPEQSFSFLGDWDVSFRYYSNNTQVTTESKITIK